MVAVALKGSHRPLGLDGAVNVKWWSTSERKRAISHNSCFANARLSLLLVEGVVQFTESLEQELSLLLVDVAECLDGLGSSWGALGDFRGGTAELATVLGLLQDEHFSETLLLFRFASLGGEADGLVSGEAGGRGVVESGEVQWVGRELLSAGLGAGWLHEEATVLLSQLP